MVLRKPAVKAEKPAAIPTEDGHAIIGGRRPATPEFYEAINRQQSGLAPRGARNIPMADMPEAALLPSLAVARNVVGKEIDRLKGEIDGLERSLAAHPARFAGNGNPYIQDVIRAHEAMTIGYRSQLVQVRADLAELEALDDSPYAVQVWAAEYLKTHPGSIRGGI